MKQKMITRSSKAWRIIILIIILIIIFSGLFFWLKKEPAASFESKKAVQQDLVQTVSVTGTLWAKKRAELSFETGGRLEEIWVEVGDQVKKGQILARLDGAVLASQLNEYLAAQAIQQEELDNMRRHWQDYTPNQREAQKQAVEKAAAATETVRRNLTKTVLRSPFDGTIAKRNFDPGEVVTASGEVLTVIWPDDFELEVDVPESDIALIKLGQSAQVELDAFSQKEIFSATVTEIDPSATEISDVIYYKVTLQFDQIDERFLDGMSADVDIHTAERKNVLAIPARAVKDEADREYVEVVQPDGSWREVNVKTGLKGDDGNIEIISGLSVGDEVVTVKKNGKK